MQSGFLDVTHMEEIAHVTGYQDPAGLSFSLDSLYWVENSLFNSSSTMGPNPSVDAEGFNVRNKKVRAIKFPLRPRFDNDEPVVSKSLVTGIMVTTLGIGFQRC